MTSALTGLYPWVGFKPSERVTVWTVGGYGAGSLMLQPGAGAPIETGRSMAMAAGGGRSELVATDAGFELAFKANALWGSTRTDAASGPGGNLESTSAAVSRLRTAIESSQNLTVASRLAVKPSLELGIRQDGGDAEPAAASTSAWVSCPPMASPDWRSTSASAGCSSTRGPASRRAGCRSR